MAEETCELLQTVWTAYGPLPRGSRFGCRRLFGGTVRLDLGDGCSADVPQELVKPVRAAAPTLGGLVSGATLPGAAR